MDEIDDPCDILSVDRFRYLQEPSDEPEDRSVLEDDMLFPPPGVVRGSHPALIPIPPLVHLETFSGEIRPHEMEPGRPYFRIVGSGQRAAGAYWTDQLPSPEDVRTSLAIKNEWNGDQGLVTLVPTIAVPCWAGRVASQPQTGSRMTEHPRWLKGGGFQIWVPRGMVDKSTGDWTVRPLSMRST